MPSSVPTDTGCGPMYTFLIFGFIAAMLVVVGALLLFFTDVPACRKGPQGFAIMCCAILFIPGVMVATAAWGGSMLNQMNMSQYDTCKSDTETHTRLWRLCFGIAIAFLVIPAVVAVIYIYLTLRWCNCCGLKSEDETAQAPADYAPVPTGDKATV